MPSQNNSNARANVLNLLLSNELARDGQNRHVSSVKNFDTHGESIYGVAYPLLTARRA